MLLWRFRFLGKAAVEGALALPIVVPEICMGVAMLLFFTRVVALADRSHLAVQSRRHHHRAYLVLFPLRRARRAARGWRPSTASWRRRRATSAPTSGRRSANAGAAHAPGLIAGALLAFTLCLDDFVITFFTSGPDTITFPVKVYSMLRFSVTPEVNAASTILIVLTIVLMTLMMLMQGKAQKKT